MVSSNPPALNWQTVYLVVYNEGSVPQSMHIIEREGVYLPEYKCWNVNLRETACRNRLIQSVPENHVFLQRADAEKYMDKLLELEDARSAIR